MGGKKAFIIDMRERRVRGLWGKPKAAMATPWGREERGRLIRARATSFGSKEERKHGKNLMGN